MKQSIGFVIITTIVTIVLSSCASTPESSAVLEENAVSIADAVRDGYVNVTRKIPSKQRVVVLGVTGNDQSEAAWADDELIHLLVNAKRYTVLDRRRLDMNLAKRKPSGEIEETSVKELGYLLGAEMVLYGNINSYHNQIRFLSLKVMDVRSGEIIAITSERFTAG
ncbi:MAG: penicillin-binding protein activator LpoB [Spirochaetaceae bacterium]|jgi:TolB-like protein|nr:penicillin-binding protein activator LpoB [Spirochaetaceae bacterium]